MGQQIIISKAEAVTLSWALMRSARYHAQVTQEWIDLGDTQDAKNAVGTMLDELACHERLRRNFFTNPTPADSYVNGEMRKLGDKYAELSGALGLAEPLF